MTCMNDIRASKIPGELILNIYCSILPLYVIHFSSFSYFESTKNLHRVLEVRHSNHIHPSSALAHQLHLALQRTQIEAAMLRGLE